MKNIWQVDLEKALERLAEVEAERDALQSAVTALDGRLSDVKAERDVAEANLAAVEVVCGGASGDHIDGVTVVRVPLVRAAARGEGVVTGHLRPLDAPGDEIAFRCQRCDQWIYNYGPWESEECAS